MDINSENLYKLLNKTKELIWFSKGTPKEIMDEVLKDKSNANEIYFFFEGILRKIGKENFEVSELDKFLKDKITSTEQLKTIKRFWDENHKAIQSEIINQSSFGNSLTSIKWRIDQLTNTKKVTEISHNVAIIELTKKNDERVVFEVDKEGINEVMKQFELIQKTIDKY